MKGDPKVLKVLNDVLRKELTGINQYFIHAKMCENWGYDVLAKHSREESIDEMKHADTVIARILFLEGTPNMSELGPILVGKDVRQQLENDLKLEHSAIKVLKPGIALCEVTVALRDDGEECHLAWCAGLTAEPDDAAGDAALAELADDGEDLLDRLTERLAS